MAQKEDGVDVGEAWSAAGRCAVGLLGILGDDVRIGADVGVVEPGFLAQTLDDGHGVRCGIMLGDTVARVGPSENHFLACRPGPRAAFVLPIVWLLAHQP